MQEYRINEMENKLTQFEGNDKNEDTEILEEKIEALSEILNKHTEVINFINQKNAKTKFANLQIFRIIKKKNFLLGKTFTSKRDTPPRRRDETFNEFLIVG